MKVYKNLKTSNIEIKAYLKSAEERVESAKVLLRKGNYRDAVSRAYYAFLDSARAALLTKGKFTKTHAGTLALFGLEFGKTKEVPAKFFRFYQEVKKAREAADYEILLRKFTKKEVEEIIEKAEEFVNFIKKTLKT